MLREGEDYPRLAWQDIAGDIAGIYISSDMSVEDRILLKGYVYKELNRVQS